MNEQAKNRIAQAKAIVAGAQLLLIGDGTPGEVTISPEMVCDMLAGAINLLDGLDDRID